MQALVYALSHHFLSRAWALSFTEEIALLIPAFWSQQSYIKPFLFVEYQ